MGRSLHLQSKIKNYKSNRKIANQQSDSIEKMLDSIKRDIEKRKEIK